MRTLLRRPLDPTVGLVPGRNRAVRVPAVSAMAVPGLGRRLRPEQTVGLVLVVALHLAALYALWSYSLLPLPADMAPVFVNFIQPQKAPEAPKPERPKPVKLEAPRPVEPPRPQQLVAEAPIVLASEPVAPPPPVIAPPPVIEAPVPAPPPKPAGPVNLVDELSVSCPERAPPSYPASARRRGEQGRVVLSVELDEQGRIARAQVATSSGSSQLDEAALAAVRQWHCNPARRGGQPVRAQALQPFNFTLEGR